MSTATAPQPASSTEARADQRSRKIESLTAVTAVALRASSTTAKTNEVMKPANATDAASGLRASRGARTATNSSTPEAQISDSAGESANQSTCGVWIAAIIWP